MVFLGYAVSELPPLYATEQWDIINTTVDVHPIHLHQVAFQLINRETIDVTPNCPATPLRAPVRRTGQYGNSPLHTCHGYRVCAGQPGNSAS